MTLPKWESGRNFWHVNHYQVKNGMKKKKEKKIFSYRLQKWKTLLTSATCLYLHGVHHPSLRVVIFTFLPFGFDRLFQVAEKR